MRFSITEKAFKVWFSFASVPILGKEKAFTEFAHGTNGEGQGRETPINLT